MAKADVVKFQNQLSSNVESGVVHDHSGGVSHSHGQIEHGHTHEHLEHAGELIVRQLILRQMDDIWLGKFGERDLPDFSSRNWVERGFTIGIGG